MGNPKQLKLGLYTKPLNMKEINEHLKNARGLVIFIFEEKGQGYIVTHGTVNPIELGNVFGACMEKSYGVKVKLLMLNPAIDPIKKDRDYVS